MNNWVFSPNILQELSVTISETEIYSIRSIYAIFHGSPTVYKYDTNGVVSMSDRQNTSNYNQMLFGSSSRVGRVFCFYWQERFYIGIKEGTCGQIKRILLYYTPCKERQDGLVNYPELVLPPIALYQTRAWLAVLPTLTPPPLSPSELTVPLMKLLVMKDVSAT